ncbi:uncharacterized protein LOC124596108 [Schistocerca americana]|uniref:uncharacterized protein LOC124596108 n=1 Tax=Schistocerca americana TaxID=7009 RepID=UPI001F4F17DC|nr:uncharacterized protein LOC124596108 [Schistocerca americana]
MVPLRSITALIALAVVVSCVIAIDIDCKTIKIKCIAIDPVECKEDGGIFIPNGGLCGYCDSCRKYVGEGESCAGQDVLQPPTPTPTCQEPLVCDPDTKTCVKSEVNCVKSKTHPKIQEYSVI